MSKIMGREIDIAYDRNPEARFFQDAELTVELDGSGITDEELAEILGGTILVRCQDCEFWIREKAETGAAGTYCGEVDGMIKPGPDDFCSRGRRRTE